MNAPKSARRWPGKKQKPDVYLAGKIGQNDWRHGLIPNLRTHEWGTGSISLDSFNYVGPFFRGCDHGCGHGPKKHGAVQECTEPFITQREVIDANKKAINNADLVIAYITAADCHGTQHELGWASAKGKRVVIAFAENIDFDADEFWVASHQSAADYRNVSLNQLREIVSEQVKIVREET